MNDVRIELLGEDALLLRLGRRIDPALNARVHALAARIADERPPWLRDIVPAYASLALCFDPEAFATAGDLDRAIDWLRGLAGQAPPSPRAPHALATVEIPVCHAARLAPDLEDVAAQAGLSVAEAIALHCAGDYRVAMIGFAPGFPYLLGLDPRLAMPRLAAPRTRVPAGSVAIGGAQTGVYPRESPGGWRVIGRTPLDLFDASRQPPCLLAAGQRVRFVAIDEARFEALRGASA